MRETRHASQRGATLIEVLIVASVVLGSLGAIYFSTIQSIRYLEMSRHERRAVADLQIVMERFQSLPTDELFAQLPDSVSVSGDLVGGYTLPGEQLVVSYLPGRVTDVLRVGVNDITFECGTYSPCAYDVGDTGLFIQYSGDGPHEFSGSGSGHVSSGASVTITVTVTDSPALSTATQVDLLPTLGGVDDVGEVAIMINGRGPYGVNEGFVGGGEVNDELKLPDLKPLRMTATVTWTSNGRAMSRTLTSARMP